MEFEKRKSATLASMNSPEPDKSPKGNIDAPIIPLLNTLNSHPSYFTTSSCSGRISILSQPFTPPTPTPTPTPKKKAKGGTWLFISHDPVHPNSVLPLLFPTTESPPASQCEPHVHANPHYLVFRFEPLIIAVECKDVVAAQTLISLAISCGFRESGITSVSKRVIIAIRCSIRLEVPLGDTKEIIVSPEYVKYLIEVANEKMEANRKRTNSFLDALLKHGFSRPDDNVKNDKEVLTNGEEGIWKEEKFESLESITSVDTVSKDLDVAKSGSSRVSGCSLSAVQMEIVGEPVERLFLYGHSASTLDMENMNKIIIFGGFGGIGRHARRNDLLLLVPQISKLEKFDLQIAPSPRLGHTSSTIGDQMYIIGGRADPVNILNDVWVLDNAKNEWRLLQCSGIIFPHRHRHAAAVLGSVIYVFGGIHDDVITSSLYAFDTYKLVWAEIFAQGDWPCARHSHSMVAYESQLYMFGGYDGEKALNDLYSFNVRACIWKKEKMSGRIPTARFSHMMFVYKNYIGILGGCPISQNHQEMSLLDLKSHLWKHINLNSISKDLFVRSTANVVGDNLIIVGGGAACYAFGTKFSEPVKINLLPLLSTINSSTSREIKEHMILLQDSGQMDEENGSFQLQQRKIKESKGSLDQYADLQKSGAIAGHENVALHWVLRLERKYAKLGKDILKSFGWLDLGRKVWSEEDGMHICFPITEKFCSMYDNEKESLGHACEGLFDNYSLENLGRERHLSKNIPLSAALNTLVACGATKVADQIAKVRKVPMSHLDMMKEAVASLINCHGLPEELLEQLPARWERLGNVIVLPATAFKDPAWNSVQDDLWHIVARTLGTSRLARQGRVSPTGTRDSTLEMLVGDNGWVEHRENDILYSFDATKCMFSWGNLSEKLRMARLDCTDEVIVDLFAGIGYFVLPFLVRAKAKLVYACEWNPFAVEALHRNLQANSVADRCIVLEGDNRVTAPRGVADRVCLGLLPTSEGSWVTAVRALRDKGGVLHIHGNVKDSEEVLWADNILKSILEISKSEDYCWDVSIEHIERVKWYAPHIRHLVADVRCREAQT